MNTRGKIQEKEHWGGGGGAEVSFEVKRYFPDIFENRLNRSIFVNKRDSFFYNSF
jgi:hypothetical protein